MNRENRLLVTILAALTLSVLVTGGLAVYLTLARGQEEAPEAQGGATGVAGEPRIVFVSDREGNAAIYTMEADGSRSQRVSRAGQGFCLFPYWSPEGQRVAYVALEEDPTEDDAQASAWVAAADGSEQVCVSQAISRVLTLPPTWSPDGTLLAFAAAGEQAGAEDSRSTIHIARTSGSGIERSIPLPWMVHLLAWSPAGDVLLLVGDSPDAGTNVHVWSSEGEEITEVFQGAGAADWSPDGGEIVVGADTPQAVFVVGLDGEPYSVARLEGYFPIEVTWSPDGTHIAVTAALVRRQEFATALYVIALETGEVTTIVDEEGWLIRPNWSPDGNRLLFTMGEMRRRPEADLPYADLWAYDVSSGQLEQLTMGESFEGLGVWSP